MKSVRSFDCNQKQVLVRVDYNVPIKDGKVINIERIKKSLATIRFLLESGAKKVVLLSHFGQPRDKSGQIVNRDSFSLLPIVDVLSSMLGFEVGFAREMSLSEERVVLLENIRFYEGEELNDINFAKELSKLGDAYVNDAFSVSHRSHASIVLLPKLLPSFIGIALEEEINALDLNKMFASKPLVAIVGGSKISTKLPIINNLKDKVGKLFLCGALANSALLHKGLKVGKSLFEVCECDLNHENIVLPQDVVTSKSLEDVKCHICDVREVPEDEMILDIGPATVLQIKEELDNAKMVLWNGPMGAFEFPPFDSASIAIGQYISDLTKVGKLQSILGGGDTLAMIDKIQNAEFSYVSGAGGAFLKWLEGKNLVGLKALTDNN